VSGWREAFGSVSFHAGEDTDVRCHTYEDATPILSLDSGRLSVSISIAGRAVPTEAVAFARELAAGAARFAAECERLHDAPQPQPPGKVGTPCEGQPRVSAVGSAA
jgi:hypothetical protein